MECQFEDQHVLLFAGFAADENAQLPDDAEFTPRLFQAPVGFMGAVSASTATLNFSLGESDSLFPFAA